MSFRVKIQNTTALGVRWVSDKTTSILNTANNDNDLFLFV